MVIGTGCRIRWVVRRSRGPGGSGSPARTLAGGSVSACPVPLLRGSRGTDPWKPRPGGGPKRRPRSGWMDRGTPARCQRYPGRACYRPPAVPTAASGVKQRPPAALGGLHRPAEASGGMRDNPRACPVRECMAALPHHSGVAPEGPGWRAPVLGNRGPFFSVSPARGVHGLRRPFEPGPDDGVSSGVISVPHPSLPVSASTMLSPCGRSSSLRLRHGPPMSSTSTRTDPGDTSQRTRKKSPLERVCRMPLAASSLAMSTMSSVTGQPLR